MMAPHDRGHDREAKAGAALAAGTTGITAEEAIEDALLIGRSDADPTVLHLQQPNVSLAPQPQPSWCYRCSEAWRLEPLGPLPWLLAVGGGGAAGAANLWRCAPCGSAAPHACSVRMPP